MLKSVSSYNALQMSTSNEKICSCFRKHRDVMIIYSNKILARKQCVPVYFNIYFLYIFINFTTSMKINKINTHCLESALVYMILGKFSLFWKKKF